MYHADPDNRIPNNRNASPRIRAAHRWLSAWICAAICGACACRGPEPIVLFARANTLDARAELSHEARARDAAGERAARLRMKAVTVAQLSGLLLSCRPLWMHPDGDAGAEEDDERSVPSSQSYTGRAPHEQGRSASAQRTETAHRPGDDERTEDDERPGEPSPGEDAPSRRRSSSTCIDINTASARRLDRLPRIGPAIAGRIIDARPYASLSDLRRVRGIGSATLQGLQDRLCAIE